MIIILYIFLAFLSLIYLITFLLIRHMNKMGFGEADEGLSCLLIWILSPIMLPFIIFDSNISEYKKGFLGINTICNWIFGIKKKGE